MSQANRNTYPIRSRRVVPAGIASTAALPITAGIATTAAATADPIYAAIERHKALSSAYGLAVSHPDVGNPTNENSEAKEISDRAFDEFSDHTEHLFGFHPS
jgi:hypothetical protein